MIKIDEERLARLRDAFRGIGASMLAGTLNAAEVLSGEAPLRRLRSLPDPWLQVWALHLAQTTPMSLDRAVEHVAFRTSYRPSAYSVEMAARLSEALALLAIPARGSHPLQETGRPPAAAPPEDQEAPAPTRSDDPPTNRCGEVNHKTP